MRTISLSLAALLTAGLTGCGGSTPSTSQAPTTQAPPPQTSQAPTSQAPTTQATSSTPTSRAPSSAPATTGNPGGNSSAGGKDTPEASAEAFLRGFGNKDGKAICDVMAVQGRPMNSIGAGEMCANQMNSTISGMGAGGDQLKQAKVTNVPVSGDTADYSKATFSPQLGKSILQTYKGQKIDGKWYVALG
ncbi:hypothetical protein CGZ93_04790 [Enemella dayhoffiae]|uniref:Lipoprotein n=1 Tax=Enemella dayhoffiae TaxID=2016507 RepID=A0A255H8S5_9ACTN|nr:hypothetical protein [Enemella dayhoffiae]OYO24138.1 hypothetical protein CGZ93_04790 [Enemella dayhoffiae]